MIARRTGARLGLGIAVLVGTGLVASPAGAATSTHPSGGRLHPYLAVRLCDREVEAYFQVDRYVPQERTWVGAAGVRVTVETRIPGDTAEDGWTPESLVPERSWSGVRTDEDGSGSVRLASHPATLEYRLLLPDGTRTAPVRPHCHGE